jgi:hypothetical protein
VHSWLNYLAEAVEFEVQGGESGGAFFEGFAGGLLFHAFEGGGDGVGANIGAGAFAGMGEAHGQFWIVLADSHVHQSKLPGGIVQEGAEELLHQVPVIQRDVPELIAVQHGSFIEYSHEEIVS